MKQPTFSIIIPTLNEEKFLPRLLKSLTLQTFRDFEVIVVDGSSKDKTVELAKEYEKKLPIRIIISKKANLPLQRNIGAKKAKGSWFIFNDADNVLFPYCLERCAVYIARQPVQLFTTWFAPDSETSGDATLVLVSNLFVEGAKTVKRQVAPGPFAAVTREAFNLVNGYDESCAYGEDQNFSMRLYEHGVELTILRETLYIYSLRRFRKQGTLKMLQVYAKASLITLLTKRSPKQMPGYIMGGHLYEKPKRIQKSLIKRYEIKLRKLMKDILEGKI